MLNGLRVTRFSAGEGAGRDRYDTEAWLTSDAFEPEVSVLADSGERCACPMCASVDVREATIFPSNGTASNGKTIFSWDEAAVQLTRGGFTWSPTLGGAITVTYAFRASEPGQYPDGVGGFSRFSATQIAAAEAALALWADVANITFQRLGTGTVGEEAYSDSASILFANYATETSPAAGFAYLPSPNATGPTAFAGDIWIDSTDQPNQNPTFGDYGVQVLAHEIGHAIGLRHPSDYDGGTPTYEANATWWQDARMFSIMSYFGSGNTGGSLGAFAAGPQLLDIAAAQRLYGANTTTRTGDSVYGFNSNTGKQHFTLTTASSIAVFSIWDGGGNDTLDLSGYSQNAQIDLRPESFTSAGPGNSGAAGLYNISIARGAIIENGIGGSGADNITGNTAANRLTGNGGDDILDGLAGADTMIGGAGSDSYGVDVAGDVVTELANAGFDTVYAAVNYTIGANVEGLNLIGGAAAGFGNALANAIYGNALANYIAGGEGGDYIEGGAENDILDGGPGDDILVGGTGSDSYAVDSYGDSIRENPNEGFDAVYANGDYALGANLEGLYLQGSAGAGYGNALANAIYGNALANYLRGEAGDDYLEGGAENDILDGSSGNDIMVGGLGSDSYAVDATGDQIGENANEGFDSVYATSSYTLGANLEGLYLTGAGAEGYGNTLANAIFGNALDNNLNGFAGNDVLNGGAGNDTFVFNPGTGQDVISDFVAGGTEDRINLSAYAGTGITYTVTQSGANTIFSFSNGDAITLQNVTATNLVQVGDYWF